jgi:sulfite exporter TauE/SafE
MEREDVVAATVSLKDETLTVSTSSAETPAALAEQLTTLLAPHGYAVHLEKPERVRQGYDWAYAVPVTLFVIVCYILLERAGLTSLIGANPGSFTTALLVGLVASVSSCLAVVGGLVLSVSATYAHEGNGWRPQVTFHLGRLGGFFLLGGLLGAVGEAVHLSIRGSAFVGILVSMVMVVLGIHLLDVTTKVRTPTLPKVLSNRLTDLAHKGGAFAPVLLGAVTFFLPCGFTQSMQMVALGSGNVLDGSLTMFFFALGTLPVLGLLSFGSLDLAKSRFRGVFFKSAGLLVILFALFNVQNALAVLGFISPIVHF